MVLFALPADTQPKGGKNVLLEHINILNANGFSAAAVYSRRNHKYPFVQTSAQQVWYPALENPEYPLRRGHKKITSIPTHAAQYTLSKFQKPKIPNDAMIVIPEYRIPEWTHLFKDNEIVFAIQDPFALVRACIRDTKDSIKRAHAVFCTSEISLRTARMVHDDEPHFIPLHVETPSGDIAKRQTIAYFPRKRPHEARFIAGILKTSLPGWNIVAIENMSNAKRDAIIRESMIFLSFSYQEGFGLPPAEAMSAECLVIGYHGGGGAEYLKTGHFLEVREHDPAHFIDRVVTAARAIETGGPEASQLHGIRATGAAYVRKTYTQQRTQEGLIEFWKMILER